MNKLLGQKLNWGHIWGHVFNPKNKNVAISMFSEANAIDAAPPKFTSNNFQ